MDRSKFLSPAEYNEAMALMSSNFTESSFSNYASFEKALATKSKAESDLKKKSYTLEVKVRNKTGLAGGILIFPGGLNTARPVTPTGSTGAKVVPLVGGGTASVGDAQLAAILYDDPTHAQRIDSSIFAVVNQNGITSNIIYRDGTTSTKTIEVSFGDSNDFNLAMNFLKQNFCALTRITVDGNDKESISGNLAVCQLRPFNKAVIENLMLSEAMDPRNLQEKRVIYEPVKMGQKIIFDDQTAIWYNIPATAAGVADVEVRFQFYLANIHNQALRYNG